MSDRLTYWAVSRRGLVLASTVRPTRRQAVRDFESEASLTWPELTEEGHSLVPVVVTVVKPGSEGDGG